MTKPKIPDADLPVNRADALAAGIIYYMPVEPCINGHLSRRYTQTKACATCRAIHEKAYTVRNAAKCKERKDRYNGANRELTRTTARNWYYNNLERSKINRDRYYADNVVKFLLKNKARGERLRRATPSWVTVDELKPFYIEARRLTKDTNIIHHVDHVVPLSHPLVCGLNVPWNLRVVEGKINDNKGNILINELLLAPVGVIELADE